jgi:ZIP family zinc transporter
LLLHNFPEGLAVMAASTLESSHLGSAVATGIMIHNIPEGIAIAVPCMVARPDMPWLAFGLALASGLAEPLGAFLAALLSVLQSSSTNHLPLLDNILACVAGVMCMVAAARELYPEAYRNLQTPDEYRSTILGTLCGIILMVATELYLPG